MDSFLRTYATPLSFVTFAATAVTGLLLFFGVHGGALSDIHEWIGVLFVAAMALHLVRNWRGMVAMLSMPRAKAIVGGLGAAAVVLILASVPFGSSGQGGGHGGGHGGPGMVMHRLAEAPIAKIAPALGLTSGQMIGRLQSGGVVVEGPEQSLVDIAEKQNAPLPRLLNLVLTEPEA